MKFGLALPHYDFSLAGQRIDWHLIRDWAQRAEEMGFDSLWVSDHLFLDLSKYGGPPDAQFSLECFTTLAALTQCTSRIRLGTLVVCNDLRHPALVAKMASTLSVFSQGRFELGMGAGWYEPEYRAAGIPFEPAGVRIEKLAESVQLVRGMLANPSFTFQGRFYGVTEAWTLPQPPPVPVSIGGKGDRVVKTAAKYADGFNAVWAWTPEAYADRIRLLEGTAVRAGRDPDRIKKTVGLYCLPGFEDSEVAARWQRYLESSPPGIRRKTTLEDWRRDKLAGTPSQMAAQIERYGDSGAEEVILSFGLIPFQLCEASAVEEFVGEVRPLVNSTKKGD